VDAEPEVVNAVLRAQALLHGLDVTNDPADREQVLSGLRHEVDTLATLLGLPLRVTFADTAGVLPKLAADHGLVPLDFGP
jgi:hypothetical protein